ncbi:MAG: UvrD-helicase domain-containing protein [Candidatus Marinimicrobia bacterium]|nr:UvrD-helicase domain-containing protein [Candidatus Neomarinimicrobiota bacterium]
MRSLIGLNPEQRKAVQYTGGPELIFAGAGSGKTKVLIHKIAYLIENNISKPQNILAVTFTNKAANELKTRIEKFFNKKILMPWVGTFHSIFAKILRHEIKYLGIDSNFTIYDTADQLELIKSEIEKNDIILGGFDVKNIHKRISFLKNKMIYPEEFEPRVGNKFDQIVKKVYERYQEALVKANALDFDDLLLYPLKLFERFPEILEKYRILFQYILVDEYQDTNKPQFYLVEALARKHRNICVVGDDDQSIYSWRGAEIENILRFNEFFPDCQVFKLEENYRSTKKILKAAAEVIKNNENRADKTLWSNNSDGEPIVLIEAQDEYDEAQRIAHFIEKEILTKKRTFRDFAVLYRINIQSRVIEEVFRRNNIMYTIIGGVRFYERKEIKDMISYFRVFLNPKDDISLKRIINFPPRGIGKVTLNLIEDFAKAKNITIYEALSHLDFIQLDKRQRNALQSFYDFINKFRKLLSKLSFEEWSRVLVDDLGVRGYYKRIGDEDSIDRLYNIEGLLNDISEFCRKNENPTIESYLENVSLISDIDTWEDTKNAVSLMTLHSAKGLEFPVVFICGLNDKLFPLERNGEIRNLEEERRLFYVGLTRAKEMVYLSTTNFTNYLGMPTQSKPSIFLSELPEDTLAIDSGSRTSTTLKRKKSNLRKERKSKKSGELEVGDRINHRIFGVGEVVKIEGYGDNARINVYFENHGLKTIIAKYLTK